MTRVVEHSFNLFTRSGLYTAYLRLQLDACCFNQVCKFVVKISGLAEIKLLKLLQPPYFVESDRRCFLLIESYQKFAARAWLGEFDGLEKRIFEFH